MSFGHCTQEVIRGESTETCGDEAVLQFGPDQTPLCIPHFEFRLARVRRDIDKAGSLIEKAARTLGGGGR